MTRLRFMLDQECKRLNTTLGLIEQDYLLSWMLYGITKVEELQDKIVFKGGTGLKKMYYGHYRLSQDLDFTSYEDAPRGDALFNCIQKATSIAEKELSARNPDGRISLTCTPYKDKRGQHPNEQEAFVIHGQFPWHPDRPYSRVMIELTRKQHIVNTPVFLNIKHGYPEPFEGKMLTFTLDEIFGEKLMAMYSNAIKLHERGWTRSRARDYYDLFRLLTDFQDTLNLQKIMNTINFKTDTKLPIKCIEDFFDTSLLKQVKRDWHKQLNQMISPLPSFEEVVPNLRIMLSDFLKLPMTLNKNDLSDLQL